MNRLAIYLLLLHFIGDFALQSDWMAQGKSKSMLPLLAHVGTYTATLFLGLMFLTLQVAYKISLENFIALIKTAGAFVLVNGGIHGLVDFVTSRISSQQWKDGEVHKFFVTIGADQFIHAATLILTMGML